MTESKTELEKSLKLSRKLRKELNSLTEWLAATDAELTRRSAVSGVPEELDAEVAWAQVPPEDTPHTRTHTHSHSHQSLKSCFADDPENLDSSPGGSHSAPRLFTA